MIDYKKILIEQHHGLGDIVHMLPMIENIHLQYPQSKITVLVRTKGQEGILRYTNLVNDYIYWPNKKSLIMFIKLIFIIRKKKFDLSFLSVITNQKLGLALLKFGGCKKIILENSANCSSPTHRVQRNLNLLRTVNIPIIKLIPDINIMQKNHERSFYKRKTIGICLGSNPTFVGKVFRRKQVNAKQWGYEKVYALILQLLKIPQVQIVLLGGEKEEKEFNDFIDLLPNSSRIINRINKVSVFDLVPQMTKYSLVLGSDTGLIYIADALGIPTITLFGPTNPDEFRALGKGAKFITLGLECQYCYGTHQLFTCKKIQCMDISVSTVLKTIMESIEGANA